MAESNEQSGTRRLMMGGAILSAVVFIGLAGWFALPSLFGLTDYLGRPSTGADKGTAGTTIGTGVPTQREAQSSVAKNDPAGTEDSSGGRARQIKQSSEPATLSQEQRQRLREIFSNNITAAVDRPNFEMMIGTAVPRQTKIEDLPPEATQVLNGYWGGEYLIAGKDLVIVDQHTRRVAAIIAGVR
jgi:Protein of unknown function (DUF1236)